MLRQKAVASEIIIRILDCPLKREFTACSHVLLVVTNRTTVSSLKRKIQGVTGIPSNRIMLLLCGEVLRDDKAFLPPEVMEPIGFITSDEDEIKFRPRIHMKTLESPEGEDDEQSAPDQDDGHIPLDDGEGVESEQNVVEKKKRKKVAQHNPFESFHLEGELKKVGCEKFAKALTDAGYGNEVMFFA